VKIKISELTGAALDWAVAKCEGVPLVLAPFRGARNFVILGQNTKPTTATYEPSTHWAQGGPIIEREALGIQCVPAGTSKGWWAIKDSTFHDRSWPDEMRGDTPLVAAMRCYVASKLGATVDIPDELAP
jgi:hypothetical protein